ncbi:MAG: energy-coupling factor transporter transmembrane protein EcfT [Candidatus Thermoplasmatota archaeon]|nr:energy-coupling factor transporter transmembrane protein EcfT [Candidatus Thermoplasmatota archaeon]
MKEDSLLNEFDPRSKLFFTLIFVVLSLLIPIPIYLLFLLAIILITAFAGRTLRELLAYMSPLKLLIPLLFILNLFFYAQGNVIWSFDLRIFILSVTYGGLETSIMILLRFFVIASAASLFAVTTGPEEFELTLVWLKIPWKLAFIFSLTLRLVPDIKRRYKKIEEAQLARGLNIGRSPIKKIKARVPMVIPFLAAIIRYGYELTEALEARNFNDIEGRNSILRLEHGFHDYILYIFSIFILSLYIYLNYI